MTNCYCYSYHSMFDLFLSKIVLLLMKRDHLFDRLNPILYESLVYQDVILNHIIKLLLSIVEYP